MHGFLESLFPDTHQEELTTQLTADTREFGMANETYRLIQVPKGIKMLCYLVVVPLINARGASDDQARQRQVACF